MVVAIPESDVNCAVSWRARPGSFVSLMSLYESNYIRLAGLIPPRLIPEVIGTSGTAVSHVEGDCPLHLRIEDHSRYTTTLTLTYMFEDSAGALSDPDLQVRVYHDARLAEAHACARWHRHSMLEAIRSELARALGERWLRNVMLNKWLDYCAERGHRFAAAVAR